jgi:DNA modification methylase
MGNAAVIFFSQGMFTAELMTGPWKKYYRMSLIWQYNKPRGFLNAKKRPLLYHADLVVFYRKQCTYNPQMVITKKPVHACKRKATSVNYRHGEGGANTRAGAKDRYPGSVLQFGVVNAEDPAKFHPTQKPVDLCQYLVRTFSNADDLVLDLCAGSGTTGVAALTENRRFVGFECVAEYHDKALSRLQTCLDTYQLDTPTPPCKKVRINTDEQQTGTGETESVYVIDQS